MHQIEDTIISQAIITRYGEELISALDSEVAVAGGGPAGLTAAYYLARAGVKVTLFERNLSIGGGMWGGGIMMNQVVFQEDARPVFEEFGVRCRQYREGYYTAHSVETVAALALGAARAGASIINLMAVEDVMVREEGVVGLVLNWGAVTVARLHVDPIGARCRFVIDSTGHDAMVVNGLVRKMGPVLNTPSGGLEGEKPLWAARGEEQIVENTREVYPGLYIAGMSANAVYGGLRMGPVFGGMLLSGRKVAEELIGRLRS